ncbi:Fasciclin-like arabinogalactan protein 19 [Linum perenne]
MKSIIKKREKQLFLDIPIIFTLLIITATTIIPTPATSIPTDSLDYILYFLRSRGHSLFANAIATSDLLFDVLALPTATILPPSDPALFAMDMTEFPSFYLAVLRLHVIPFRIDLRYLQNNASLHTLVSSRRLHSTRSPDGLRLDGVEVLVPALYDTVNVAVFALNGMLPSRVPRHRNRSVIPRARVPSTITNSPPVPISSGTNFSAPELTGNSSAALSPPEDLIAPPPAFSAPDNGSVLEFPHNGPNRTVHHQRHPPINDEAPALPPDDQSSTILTISPSANTAFVSSTPEISGNQYTPAFPPIATADTRLPPVAGDLLLPPINSHTFEPTSAPSPQNLSVALTPTLAPAVYEPDDLANPAPVDSAFHDTVAANGDVQRPSAAGWSDRNAGEGSSSGNDYPVTKKDDGNWEGGSGGDLEKHASRKDEYEWGHVNNGGEDYDLMDPSEMDYNENIMP